LQKIRNQDRLALMNNSAIRRSTTAESLSSAATAREKPQRKIFRDLFRVTR
jgi:hypothetical protein